MTKAELEVKFANEFPEEIKYIKEYLEYQNEMQYLAWHEEKPKTEHEDYYYNLAEERIRRAINARINPANIKIGDGVTVKFYTDYEACTVIAKTKCSVTVQRDKATLDPNFKPEWIPGGFAGHCTNQDEQTYTYERDENGVTYKMRWSDKYGMFQNNGLKLIKGRHEFYDYNF